MKIGFLNIQNYWDRNTYSGILYCMYKALNGRDLNIVPLGEPYYPSVRTKIISYWNNSLSALKLVPNNLECDVARIRIKIQSQLNHKNCDVIFAPVASREIANLSFNCPVVFLSDATVKLISEEYQGVYQDVAEFEKADREEKVAIEKADKVVYASNWAAQSAIQDYQGNPEKIIVIPYGSNLDPPSRDEVLYRRASRSDSSCNLLFVGKDWSRKGGDIAFETFLKLLETGIGAELWIVGCRPPKYVQHKKIQVINYLDKNNPGHRKRFNELFLRADFLILPTRAECYGIVLAEANAFGLPVLTTEVGGIPTIVKDGKNGYMLPISASGSDFATLVMKIFSKSGHYQQLVHGAREEYESRLNWNAWVESIHCVFIDVLTKSGTS